MKIRMTPADISAAQKLARDGIPEILASESCWRDFGAGRGKLVNIQSLSDHQPLNKMALIISI